MNPKLLSAAIAAAFLGSGCASTITGDIAESVDKTDQAAKSAMESMRSAQPVEHAAPVVGVRRVNAVWVPVSKVRETDYRSARVLNRNVIVNRDIASLREAASYITLLTGVPVSVASRPANATSNPSAAVTGGVPTTPPPTTMGFPGVPGVPGAGNTVDVTGFVSYSGSLAGFMDVISARFGVYWEPEGDGVRFFYTKPRTFRLSALPGNSSMTSTVGTTSSNSSGSGGGSSSSSAQMNSGIAFSGMSVWTAIEDSVKAMLTPMGRVVVTPATGTITVDDTPPTLEKVEQFVRYQNAALARQVVLNVRVLSVELTDSDAYGVNWNAVYQNLGRGAGMALNTVSGLSAVASTLSFNVSNTGSMWNGTEAMIEALSKQGRVSQITSASILTINNQPAPIQVGRQRSYLASSTTTIGTGGSGNTTTLVPGVVTTGFSMSVLPHILDNGRLMLQYAGDISSLVDIATVSSNGSSIQTPEIDTRNFLQRVIMNNGETLVLTGFEQFGVSGNQQGIGSANNLALGGSARASRNKTVLVVLIQPVIASGER